MVVTSLPKSVRGVLRLASLDGRSLLRTGQELADLLGSKVKVAVGSPAAIDRDETAGGLAGEATAELRMVDATGRSWRPLAQTIVCSPNADSLDGLPCVAESRVPAALCSNTGSTALALGKWMVVVTPAGLWIGPRDSEPPIVAMRRQPSPEKIDVDIEVPQLALDDSLWPSLDILFGQMEPEVRERIVIHISGAPDVQVWERLLEAAVHHGLRSVEPRGFAVRLATRHGASKHHDT
ncbi:hypothetical protein [Streptomyces sp. NBC_01455]|uniref:hypothetical protein n=1 Tax=Streptomyces sp. NBC_01455 TaxID=2903874 RepID=UPI002E351AB0|nr:hypothetical protein [Streptomyces sp. NBC_01455]